MRIAPTLLHLSRSTLSREALLRLARDYAGALTILAVIFAVGAAGLVFLEVADEVLERESDSIDRAVLMWLRPSDPPRWLVDVMRDITALGSTVVLTIWVAITALFLIFSGRGRACLFVVAAAASGALMSSGLKLFFDRERPDLIAHGLYVSTASFPSGHAMISTVVYLTLGALIAELVRPPWLKVYVVAVAAVLAGLIGFSRLYLGVHWPTDVVAGWAAGAGWAIASWGLARVFLSRPRGTRD
jgi:undecaprenyl-diphosphatase